MRYSNLTIRLALAEAGMHQYDLARLLGIAESTCSKLLRDELPEESQKRIAEIIKKEASHD